MTTLIPADLNLQGSQDPSDKNYFDVKVQNLLPNQSYGIQFQWLFEDGTTSPWSATKKVLTDLVPAPGEPNLQQTDVLGGQGVIAITWGGKNTSNQTIPNVSRVDIHISGGKFGDGSKASDAFFTTGTKSIAAEAGTYYVQLKAISTDGKTVSVFSQVRTVVVTGTSIIIDPSVTPSAPTAKPVIGAIQVTWDGKTSTNTDQPSGFYAAKVYVGTTAGFTPSTSNQVDTLNFGGGTNTVNVGVGTQIGPSTYIAYNTDYYVKIITTNGNPAQDSAAVTASPAPVRVGKAGSGDIISVLFDQVETGTLQANATLTVGAPSGKRVELKATGDPLTIYDTNGTTKLLSYGTNKLTIIGDGTFSGDLSAASGSFTGSLNIGTQVGGVYPFNVTSTGIVTATSGTIGGLKLSAQSIGNDNDTFKIDKDGIITLGATSGEHLYIDKSSGITHKSDASTITNKLKIGTDGKLQLGSQTGTNYLIWDGSALTIKGSLTVEGSTNVVTSGPTGTLVTALANYKTADELNTILGDYAKSNDIASTYMTNSTNISGGRITSGVIQGGTYTYTSGSFSTSGIAISLDTGFIRTPYLYASNSGIELKTPGTYPLVLDSANDRIIFKSGSTGSYVLDSDSTPLTYNTASGSYTSTGSDATGYDDDGYDFKYFSSATTSVTAVNDTISLKRYNTSAMSQPKLTLSTAGNGFAQLYNRDANGNVSALTAQNGAVILEAPKGFMFRGWESLAPHYGYTSAKSYYNNGYYLTGNTRETPATLGVYSDGTLTAGRSFYKTTASEATITSAAGSNIFLYVGRNGDVMFSTNA